MPEAVAWWPLRRGREQFDLTPALSPAERAALAAYAAVLLDGPPAARRGRSPDPATLAALHRLEAPVAAVWELAGTQRAAYLGARRVLFAAARRHDRPYWTWDRAEWLAVLCPSSKAFTATYGAGVQHARSIVLAVAYLFGDMTDLRPAGLSQAGVRLAEIIFGDAAATALARVRGVLYGPTGLGYAESAGQWQRLRWTTCLALLLNRSPRLEDVSLAFLQALHREAPACAAAKAVPQLAQALQALGLLTWTPAPSGYPEHVAPGADAGMAPEWAAWCWAWYRRDTQLGQATRRGVLAVGFMVGRWLQAHHPAVTSPEQWDEDLALDYVHYLCAETRIGDDLIPGRPPRSIPPAKLGRPPSPRTLLGRLAGLRRLFTDWQTRPHRIAGEPARRLPVRFNPQQALATPRRLRELVHPDPRDIDLGAWYKLIYAAAHLGADDLPPRLRRRYPLALYRALALLWVTSARRTNELLRLRVGCVRREWAATMLDETGQPLAAGDGELCYLHVPPNKTSGAFWIWIPDYTADAIVAWERLRPGYQARWLDPKDNAAVDLLFLVRNKPLGKGFLNRQLLPLLCRVAGIPERDACGQITAHRGRATRATLLRRLGVPLADIAAYLGHANDTTVRHYARTDDTQLALTIRRADARSRVVDVLFDPTAAGAGQPSVFFALGPGPDGAPRYCGNPAWASCPHRLACLKCQMYIGGSAAELLEVRAGIIRLQAVVPMTPEEQAAADGDVSRLNARLAELQGVPVPEPPSAIFVFNPVPASTTTARRQHLAERLAVTRRDLAAAEAAGQRTALVRALRLEIAGLEAAIADLTPSPEAAGRGGAQPPPFPRPLPVASDAQRLDAAGGSPC